MSKYQTCNQAELNKLSNYQVTLSRGTCNSVEKTLNFYGTAFKQFMCFFRFLWLWVFLRKTISDIFKHFFRAPSRLMIVWLARGVFAPSVANCTEMRNKRNGSLICIYLLLSYFIEPWNTVVWCSCSQNLIRYSRKTFKPGGDAWILQKPGTWS